MKADILFSAVFLGAKSAFTLDFIIVFTRSEKGKQGKQEINTIFMLFRGAKFCIFAAL